MDTAFHGNNIHGHSISLTQHLINITFNRPIFHRHTNLYTGFLLTQNFIDKSFHGHSITWTQHFMDTVSHGQSISWTKYFIDRTFYSSTIHRPTFHGHDKETTFHSHFLFFQYPLCFIKLVHSL